MSVVVGYQPHKGGRGSLDLGLQLAHALDEPLAVVTVVPRQWSTPSLARVDAEYTAYAEELGQRAEAQAREYLAASTVDLPLSYRPVTGRSIGSALLRSADDLAASVLVLGSSTDGQVGRVVVGSTADKLLHSSPIPVAISPRDFRSTAADGVTRLTCAFSDSEHSAAVVARAYRLSERIGASFRVASFGVRGHTMYPPLGGISAEDSVLDSWTDQARRAQQGLVSDGVVPEAVVRVIATGSGWGDSVAGVDWTPNELLTIGSSEIGALARVFLGSRATKLIRHAPVPVLVLPSRGA